MRAEDLGNVVIATKKLEQILESNYGAVGRGLHEKVSSVSGMLDDKIVKQLRYIASVRNKAVHQSEFSRKESVDFFSIARSISSALEARNVRINSKVGTTATRSDAQGADSGGGLILQMIILAVLHISFIAYLYSFTVDLIGETNLFLINFCIFVLSSFIATVILFPFAELIGVKLSNYRSKL